MFQLIYAVAGMDLENGDEVFRVTIHMAAEFIVFYLVGAVVSVKIEAAGLAVTGDYEENTADFSGVHNPSAHEPGHFFS